MGVIDGFSNSCAAITSSATQLYLLFFFLFLLKKEAIIYSQLHFRSVLTVTERQICWLAGILIKKIIIILIWLLDLY